MRVITCFSYKGGSGRTVAAANIAAALAAKGQTSGGTLNFKVALLDLDVCSAGTHRVFEIRNSDIANREFSLQDYLMNQVSPGQQAEKGGVTPNDHLMSNFTKLRGADGNCRDDLTLFFSRPTPDQRFVAAKYHENLLLELILELESKKFDYVILDGEAGTRTMADIAIRLADVLLMFFRLTWQHIDGTLKIAERFVDQGRLPEGGPSVYLVPTCVPLVRPQDGVYQEGATGLAQLRRQTESMPVESGLNQFLEGASSTLGHFMNNGLFIHDSLILKGGERVLVYDVESREDRATSDYYRIARELSRLHVPWPVRE